MITHRSESPLAIHCAGAAVLSLLAAFAVAGRGDEPKKPLGNRESEEPLGKDDPGDRLGKFYSQVEAIKRGESTQLGLYFVNGADAKLKRVSGLKKVDFVNVHGPTDITDAGIKVLATFPDLKTVGIFDLNVPATWPKLLKECPQLERVWLTPSQPLKFGMADFLSIETLRDVYLNVPVDSEKPGATEADDWFDATLASLRTAKQLKSIKLTGPGFVRRKATVAKLQRDLPGCKISLFLSMRDEVRGKPTPLTDDKR